MNRPKPILVPLHVDQMQWLLGLIDSAGITRDREEHWIASRTRQALLGGLALHERYYGDPVESAS